jgi:hypothetical protein
MSIRWSEHVMLGRCPIVCRLAVSIVLAACLAGAPMDWASPQAAASDDCTLAPAIRATTCRLADGTTVEGSLGEPGGSATYRVDVFSPDTTLELALAAPGESIRATVLDWRGNALGSTVRGDADQEARLSIGLPLPGAYGVHVSGDTPTNSQGYRLRASLKSQRPVGRPVWPPALANGDGVLAGERQIVRTPRGGTPAGGVAVARAPGVPPAGEVADFTLVADVQFEQIVGPSALSVRFRYQPEAGGGTGYLISLDPFAGTISLDGFDEGQRRSIVGDLPLPFMPTSESPNRLILHAEGSAIRVTLDGVTILEANDSRYPLGLIAVGAVTWSDPVAVVFDHLQVTVPPS